MANDKLAEQSMDFSVDIINLVKKLKEQRESIISNQIGRSGTSIGANIREAKYAHGTADFISKMQIALKEANETGYWLELLYKTNYIDEEQYNLFESKCISSSYACSFNKYCKKQKIIFYILHINGQFLVDWFLFYVKSGEVSS